MTRQEFMNKLRSGLSGLPATTIADICSDYETHFTEGASAGRSEADVAAALGDPSRLARELRAEAGLKAWQETRSPSTAATAIFAVLGLCALDIMFVLPILMGIGATLFGFFIAVIVCLIVGGVMLVGGPFYDGPGGIAGVMFAGFGLMAGSISIGALLTLVTVAFVNGLVWYGRLHYRLLKPAIES
jgi:uncharacterized membrane protein